MFKKHSAIPAVIFALLCMSPYSANAGSTQPNPKALSASAASASTIQTEVQGLFKKLAKDPAFAKKFDAAAFAKDEKGLIALIREAGVKSGEVSIDEIAPDVKVTITIKTRWGKISITVEW